MPAKHSRSHSATDENPDISGSPIEIDPKGELAFVSADWRRRALAQDESATGRSAPDPRRGGRTRQQTSRRERPWQPARISR